MEKYCLDTNILIEPWNKHFAIHRAPQYWQMLDDKAKEDIVFCTMEVKRELEKKNDGLHDWAKKHKHLFKEVDEEVQEHLREIMAKFPRLVDSLKFRSPADPWVVAHAICEEAVVVTRELLETKSNRIKIPNVCQEYGVRWIDENGFLDEIGFKF